MEKRKWYYHPAQVRFYDKEQEVDFYGIAFENFIICGCCGGKISLEDEEVEIREEYPWIDISDAIEGR